MAISSYLQARYDAAYRVIAPKLQGETHNDASLFRLIGQIISMSPMHAQRVAYAIADYLDEQTGEVSYSDALAEAYRRAVFQPDSPDDDLFCGDPDKADEYARDFVVIAQLVN